MSATKTKVLICPYCGDTQPAGERCRVCGGLFEPLSRQASHNAMGPWFVREERRPFQPGASYETIVKLIERGLITKYTILRCPTTKQFWTVARRVPGIAHLLGYCHNCDATVDKEHHGCPSCGVPFGAYLDRNYLGLPEVKPLPWEAPLIDEGRARGIAQRGFQPSAGSAEGGVGGAIPGPEVDFRRAAEPLGLSSFASDDELRGMASVPPHAYAPPAGSPSPSSDAADFADHANGEAPAAAVPALAAPVAGVTPVTRGLALDSANSVAARTMQRRLQRQQQTIRLLMIVLGLVSILAVVIIVAMLVRFAQNQPDGPAGSNASPSNSNAGAAAKPSDGRSTAPNPPVNGNQPVTQPLDSLAPPTTLPIDDLPTPPPVTATASFKSDHERATALLIAAKKEDRPLKDRIKDGEMAVALLKNIKAKAPQTEKPAGLDQDLVEAERLVERLKLQEFFP